jgi:predicted unusual protein kinase regulating ubiquinone biosynthesis (AarF/ABC1/UbiB family)
MRVVRKMAAVSATVVGSAAIAGGVALVDRDRRLRVTRTLRVWRLLTRRAVHFAAVKTRAVMADDERRRQLDEQFLIRSAADVANELGQMKGVVMKAGQMLSFLLDGLPEAAQQSLAALQADAPPMAPSLAAQVVRDELGADPREIFLEWDEVPVAAASIGQVHRAVTRDGRRVAVKVQYPGIDRAFGTDLANAELLYAMFSSFALKSLDVKGLVEELRVRMLDELDYRLEASCQSEFAARYAAHPFVRIPAVIEELSTRRVLTSEWVDGLSWPEFLDRSTEPQRQSVAEVLFRFVQGSIYRNRVFNGDPHPGNYRFHLDGTVTFFDFGLVKRWAPGELETLAPLIDPLLQGDGVELVHKMVEVGFLAPDHGLDPHHVWEYVVLPYRPYLSAEYTFPRDFTSTTMASILDIGGPYADVIAKLNMPSSFVILDRVVWGMSALLGRLAARNRWREILDEYRFDAPAATDLGRLEAAWRATRPTVR